MGFIMNQFELLKVLKQARYKILVAIRPLASARLAFDMVVAEIAGQLRQDGINADDIEGLKFND